MPVRTVVANKMARMPSRGQLMVPGLIQPGNVDLFRQPEIRNPDGTTSTVHSSSYNLDGVEVLLPSVTPDGRHLLTDDDIIAEYYRTGRHLGKFRTPQDATAFAGQLHRDYEAGRYRLNGMRAPR